MISKPILGPRLIRRAEYRSTLPPKKCQRKLFTGERVLTTKKQSNKGSRIFPGTDVSEHPSLKNPGPLCSLCYFVVTPALPRLCVFALRLSPQKKWPQS